MRSSAVTHNFVPVYSRFYFIRSWAQH